MSLSSPALKDSSSQELLCLVKTMALRNNNETVTYCFVQPRWYKVGHYVQIDIHLF